MKLKPQFRLLMAILAIVVVAYTQLNAHARSAASNSSARLAVSKPVVSAAAIPNAVVEWNATAASLTVLPASAIAPVAQGRVMAIVQVAVHDAVNGITGEYETYLSPGPAPANASPEAAAIAAAHYALVNLFSSQTVMLDGLYTASLAAHEIADNDPGLAYGQSAAAAILALRANDNSAQAQFDYTVPITGPGAWIRIGGAPALLPGWGNVSPFVLHSGSQFRPDGPPALGSDTYTRDYNEIKEIGSSNSSTRTTEQSNIALFWRASPTAIWNPVMVQLLATRDFNLSATARMFALLYMAAHDAGVACWDAKYAYNFWRPMLAIRGGEGDGNDLTAGDLSWTPFLQTPPHPEYPSGHSTNSSAMAAVLASFFGDTPGVPMVVTLTGITRQWTSLSEGVDEVIDARVYSGIHFRNTDEVGARLGKQVARFVITHALGPCRGNGSRC